MYYSTMNYESVYSGVHVERGAWRMVVMMVMSSTEDPTAMARRTTATWWRDDHSLLIHW